VVRRQLEAAPVRIPDDDAAGGHGPEPFADIAFVEVGGRRDLRAGGRLAPGHGVEEAAAVPDGDHHREGAAVEDRQQALGEVLIWLDRGRKVGAHV